MLDSISTRSAYRQPAGEHSDDKRTSDRSFEEVYLLFGGCGERASQSEKTDGELSDAQRYMINNAKLLATATMMVEDEDEESCGLGDDEEKIKKVAGKSGNDNEIAKMAFHERKRGEEAVPAGGGGLETEIVEMPDGLKVMIVKMEITPGNYTTMKIPINDAGELVSSKDGEVLSVVNA